MSLLHEGASSSPIGEEQARFKSRPTEQEVLAQKRRAVRIARENGVTFTTEQLNILELRGYFKEEGPQPSFRKLKEEGLLEGKTFQAASGMEERIFGKITRKTGIKIGNARDITPQEEQFVQDNPNLSARQGAIRLGRSHATVSNLKDRLKIPRIKSGRGRKVVISHETLVDLYVDQGLTSSEVGEVVGYGEKVVSRNLREQGFTVRRGRNAHSRKQR